MGDSWRIRTDTEEETRIFGKELARTLQPGMVVCLFGDLAAGKTTLVKGIVEELTGLPSETVNSPTFTYLHIYPGPISVYHFDLYRLRDVDEFLSLGFEEMLHAGGVCCIEWSERIESLIYSAHGIPGRILKVTLSHAGGDARSIEVV